MDYKFKVGDAIKILYVEDEPNYVGKTGIITSIDDIGQLHGTWGGCAIIPSIDKIVLLNNEDYHWEHSVVF